MQIGVLGPLTASHAGTSLVPSAAKPRTVLAVLAARVGDVVPVDVLMTEIWPVAPPRHARTVLQTYVATLRRALEATGGGEARRLLRTAGDGYALDCPADDVDRVAFERLALAGHEASRAQDHERAARSFGRALDLWRGTPFGDVRTGPTLGAEARRLAEERLNVVDRRIEAELHLGRHHELLGELATLTESHPSNERLTSHRMVALYRCGRRTDVLDAYQRLCHHLMAETGLEPSPALRRLRRSMLATERARVEPALDGPRPAGVQDGDTRPGAAASPTGGLSPELAGVSWEVSEASDPGAR